MGTRDSIDSKWSTLDAKGNTMSEDAMKRASGVAAPSMRKLTAHKTNECNQAIEIEISSTDENRTAYYVRFANVLQILKFQNGTLPETGVNGITQEVLLAIVIDRLQGFQAGPFACRENALALTKLQEAMHWLYHRTIDRETRGVEGTHLK